jgi:hypothetical protein
MSHPHPPVTIQPFVQNNLEINRDMKSALREASNIKGFSSLPLPFIVTSTNRFYFPREQNWLKLVCNVNIFLNSPDYAQKTSTKLYVHEFGF